jgi:DNA-binding NarL/FixJ family response regulator
MQEKPRSTPMFSPEPTSADDERGASSIRVLIVDDYEPFRRFVCSALKRNPQLQIVSQASDGLEAVQKAEALQPDLIVLDIGLPKLNGIEAARRIQKLSPRSKIVFVSQESSAEIVQEALSLGAFGYVVKTHAATELLAAVEAAGQGRHYVGGGLSTGDCSEATKAPIPERVRQPDLLSLPAPRKNEIRRSHAVQFYSDDASLLLGFTGFIEAALSAENVVIVVATEPHRNALFQRLRANGVNIGAAIEQGKYIPLDVNDTLAAFMGNDLPDPVRFRKIVGDLLAGVAKGVKSSDPRIAACGECAPTLWAQGKAEAAVQLEHLWDEIARSGNINILCGYVLNSFQRNQESNVYERICAEHSAVCLS